MSAFLNACRRAGHVKGCYTAKLIKIMSDSGPSCLIFGGTGFIGRHLVAYLTREQLCGRIKVVDKVPPELSWMNEEHQAAFRYARKY